MSTTATYDATWAPACTITKTTSTTSGRSTYEAEIDLEGVDPVRSVTAEERVRGISSLSPPTVSAESPNALIRLAVVACGTALHNTDGESLTGYRLALLSFSVSFSILQCLRLLGDDV